jgi:hypothetical protein
VVGAYQFSGNALAAHTVTSANCATGCNARNPEDVQTIAARVRYSW